MTVVEIAGNLHVSTDFFPEFSRDRSETSRRVSKKVPTSSQIVDRSFI